MVAPSGRLRIVQDVWSRGSLKTMCELEISGWGTITSTADHRFMDRAGSWREAQDLKPGDILATSTCPDNDGIESLVFPDVHRVPETFIGSGGQQRNGSRIAAPASIDLSGDALFTFGYYLGDGFASTTNDKGRFVSLAGNDTTKVAAISRCSRWFAAQGVLGRTRASSDGGHGRETRYYGTEWARWFASEFGRTGPEKHLPEWAFGLSVAQKRVILEGMVSSDGYRRDGGAYLEYVTGSNALAAGCLAFVASCGFRPSRRGNVTGQHVIGWSEGVPGSKNPGIVRSMNASSSSTVIS